MTSSGRPSASAGNHSVNEPKSFHLTFIWGIHIQLLPNPVRETGMIILVDERAGLTQGDTGEGTARAGSSPPLTGAFASLPPFSPAGAQLGGRTSILLN